MGVFHVVWRRNCQKKRISVFSLGGANSPILSSDVQGHNTTAIGVVVRILLLVNAVCHWWCGSNHDQSGHAKECSCWQAVWIMIVQMSLRNDWGS